jgi:hypothetical protein
MSINGKNLLSSVAFIVFSASSTFASDFSNLEFRSQATTTPVNRAQGPKVDSSKLEFRTNVTNEKEESSYRMFRPAAKGPHTNSNPPSSTSRVELDDKLKGWFSSSHHTDNEQSSSSDEADFMSAAMCPGSSNWDRFFKAAEGTYSNSNPTYSTPGVELDEELKAWFLSSHHTDNEQSSSSDEADFMSAAMCPGSSNWDRFFKAAEGTYSNSNPTSSTPRVELDEELKAWFSSSSHRDNEQSSSSDEADFMSAAMRPGSPNWDMVMNLVNGTHEVSKPIPSALQAQLNIDNSREEPEESVLPNVRNITEENLNQNLAEALTKRRQGMYGKSSSGFNDEDFNASQFGFFQVKSALGTNGETDFEKYNRLKPISEHQIPQGYTQKAINIRNDIRSAKAFVKKYEIEQQLKANQRNDALKNVTTIENKDWVTREKEKASEAGLESSMGSSWE